MYKIVVTDDRYGNYTEEETVLKEIDTELIILSPENVILADHTGWYSEKSKVELKTKASLNILAVLKGRKPIYPVNDI